MVRVLLLAVLTGLVTGLAACAAGPSSGKHSGAAPGPSFSPAQLAKTDIDRVAEAHRREIFAGLKLLAEKLYRRNPREWRRGGWSSGDAAVARLFDEAAAWHFTELSGKSGVEALQLSLREDFRGDRVFALIAGLGGMVHAAFNEKTEFFMTDELDAQKLYNAARNVEIADWKLSQSRDAKNEPILLSNEMNAGAANLSFEREFGKIIGSLDVLAAVIAEKGERTLVKLLQSIATAMFLPVPGR